MLIGAAAVGITAGPVPIPRTSVAKVIWPWRRPGVVPNGDSPVENGDHVIVFAKPENVPKVLEVFRAVRDA